MILVITLAPLPAATASLDYPNRYRPMAESMFDMLDAFSNVYQQRLPQPSPVSPPLTPPLPGGGWPGVASPWQGGAPAAGSPLDGRWRGRGGEVLVIRNGWFRIYRDRRNYREGQLRINDARSLSLYERDGVNRRDYEYAEQQGRLALRDAGGNLLLFRRID